MHHMEGTGKRKRKVSEYHRTEKRNNQSGASVQKQAGEKQQTVPGAEKVSGSRYPALAGWRAKHFLSDRKLPLRENKLYA